MAQATNSTEGTIVLSGDLLGNDAYNPTLRPSGVTPGTYNPIKKMYVDSKGRITSIKEMSNAEILAAIGTVPDATTSSRGYVQVGSNISVSSGTISVPNATTSSKGAVQIASGTGAGLSVSSGTVSLDTTNLPDATTSSQGVMRVGAGLNASSGVISVPDATTSSQGVMQLGDGLVAPAGVLATANATTSTIGGAKTGTASTTGIDIDGSGVISARTGSASQLGLVRIGSGLSITGGGVLTLNDTVDATTSNKGVVQVGSGFNVSAGVLSVQNASSTPGVAQIGGGLTATGANLSLPVATTGVRGAMQPGSGINISAGVISVDPSASDATTSSKGVVQIGSNLLVTGGVVSRDGWRDATAAVKGLIQVGSGFTVSSGSLSVAQASTSTFGGCAPGTGISVDGDWVITADDATTSTKGIVNIGSNIKVTSGTISIPNASTIIKGVMQAGVGVNITNGVLGIGELATTSSKGVVQIGNQGISVVLGVISTVDASTSIKGVVRIGSGLAVSSGTMSAALATSSSVGAVQFSSDFVLNSGPNNWWISSSAVPFVATRTGDTGACEYTGAVAFQPETLSISSGSVSWGRYSAQVKYLTLNQNATLSSPVTGGAWDGGISLTTYDDIVTYIVVTQDSTGGWTLNTGLFWTDGGSVNTAANSVTILRIANRASSSQLRLEHYQI